MNETFSCTFSNCDRVFLRAFELKKHKATHDNPNSVFHCPQCDFITLQKKSLGIHFATHTGEKVHGCPDMISFGAREHHCDYRTHDPAALSKHRKKVHGYIPPPNRSRPKAAPAAPRKTRQKKDEKISRRPRPPQRPASASRRKPSRVPRKTQIPRSRLGLTSTLADPTPFVPLEGVDGDVMDVDCYEDFGYDSSGATLVGSDDEMGLDTLFDPSLRSQWMAKFEMAYSTFDLTGLKYQPEPVPSSDPTCLDVRAGQQGCLCPEWMVEAGIEGWDQSVLESHQEYYVIDA